ncbi:hypothetical protein [Campylobacter sputorum]|uniref:hypothetical protein n=1 Tax=Campylobacter sputorum TaxID=206 RepID=UPI001E64BDFB|nr:hypothetical protein [Campylobacter sputorum]
MNKFIINLLDSNKESDKIIIDKIKQEKSSQYYKTYNCRLINANIDVWDTFVIFNNNQFFALKSVDNIDYKYKKNIFCFTNNVKDFNAILDKYTIVNIFDRKNPKCDYKVGFSDNIFVCFSEISTDSNLKSQNIFKILFLQIVCIEYKKLNEQFLNEYKKLSSELNKQDLLNLTDKIKDFRLRQINLNLYKNHIGDETYQIYMLLMDYFEFKKTFEDISKSYEIFFVLKTKEYEIDNANLQTKISKNIENLLEKENEAREIQNKQDIKIRLITISIAILTIISIIADGLSIFDRFFSH